MRLSEQTVLVTGADSGSGEAVVRRFRAEGASIVALGRRAGPLEALAAELPSVVASPAARRRVPGDAVLLGIVLLWSLNFSAAKYLLGHGFQPLVYGVVRYVAAALLLTSFVLWRERSLRFERRDLLTLLAAGAAGTIVNQFAFAYAIKLSGVTTTALLIGTIPAVTALVAAALGVERLRRRAVVAGAVSFAGVGLVVAGSGGSLTASVLGELCGLAVALSWALYTVLLKPLSERYSPFRIYAVVLCEGALLMAIGGAGQLHAQRWEISGVAWLIMAAGTIGPLVLANVLWVICVGKVGPSRATLFSNLQPVFATVFAVLLVAESVGWIQVAGGALIGVAIAIGRRTARGMDSTRKGVAKRALRGMARGRASR